MTDIPSILSRSSFIIFDPNVKFLTNRIRNHSSGIRIDFDQNKSKYLHYYSDQFKPYENMFGFSMTESAFSFPGTLIRLPLRFEESKISDKLYNSASEVAKLFEIVLKNADSLLLFTQSVQKVEFYVMTEDSSEMKFLFDIGKSPIDGYYKKHSVDLGPTLGDEFSRQSSLLRAAALASKNNM